MIGTIRECNGMSDIEDMSTHIAVLKELEQDVYKDINKILIPHTLKNLSERERKTVAHKVGKYNTMKIDSPVKAFLDFTIDDFRQHVLSLIDN